MPEPARGVFPSGRLDLARRYADLLATEGVVRGLIGPREAGRIWERHLLNCAVLAGVVPQRATVCDVGSGAGLPGLVLAIARPDLSVTLVEPLLRRTAFLEETVADLGLDRVEVVRARAEALHGERSFEVVTSRAVAPLERLVRWSMPLVSPAGAMVAMKGAAVAEEVPAARALLRKWRCTEPEVLVLGQDQLPIPTTAVRVSWQDPAAVGWPPPARAARTAGPRRRSSRGGQQR